MTSFRGHRLHHLEQNLDSKYQNKPQSTMLLSYKVTILIWLGQYQPITIAIYLMDPNSEQLKFWNPSSTKVPFGKQSQIFWSREQNIPLIPLTIQDDNRTSRNTHDEEIISQQRSTRRSSQNSSRRMSMRDSNFQQRQTLSAKFYTHALHRTV